MSAGRGRGTPTPGGEDWGEELACGDSSCVSSEELTCNSLVVLSVCLPVREVWLPLLPCAETDGVSVKNCSHKRDNIVKVKIAAGKEAGRKTGDSIAVDLLD